MKQPTSYFSQPEETLDPRLFEGEDKMRGNIRAGLLGLLFGYLDAHYTAAHAWTNAWVAGSGVSYQWSAAREPGDLDVLVGVDYPSFRASNSAMAGLSDTEISREITDGFREHLQPKTTNWHGYEVTFYVNPHATNILSINPYAAYDLIGDRWTVYPDMFAHAPQNREWAQRAKADDERAKEIVRAYTKAHGDLHRAPNDAGRRNAERYMNLAIDQAVALYDDIHLGRSKAFSPNGEGYGDWNNYRWQAGKASGTIQALHQIKAYHDQVKHDREAQTYGIEIPDVDTLTRRAALYRTVR